MAEWLASLTLKTDCNNIVAREEMVGDYACEPKIRMNYDLVTLTICE